MKYEQYKDSGIDYIGEIPEHWEVSKVGKEYYIIGGSTPQSDNSYYWTNGNIIWITPTDFKNTINQYLLSSERKITLAGLQSCGTKISPPKSIVMSTRAPIGHIALTAEASCTNQGCKSFYSKNSNNYTPYGYYFLMCNKKHIQSLGKGATFLEVSKNKLSSIRIPVPPTQEQIAIANYLDKKVSAIDGSIQKYKDMAEALKKTRKVMISDVITKGLNPDVKLKDSGIDYIGEIPEHWEVSKVGKLSKVITGNTPENIKLMEDDFIPFIRPEDIYPDRITNLIIAKDGISRKYKNKIRLIPPKSILITSIGTIGKIGINEIECFTNQQINAIILKKEDNSLDYYKYVMFFLKSIFIKKSSKTIISIISGGKMKQIRIPVPPMSEQIAIAEYLDKKVSAIDKAIDKVYTQVKTLEKLKKVLISDVITGKKRVYAGEIG